MQTRARTQLHARRGGALGNQQRGHRETLLRAGRTFTGAQPCPHLTNAERLIHPRGRGNGQSPQKEAELGQTGAPPPPRKGARRFAASAEVGEGPQKAGKPARSPEQIRIGTRGPPTPPRCGEEGGADAAVRRKGPASLKGKALFCWVWEAPHAEAPPPSVRRSGLLCRSGSLTWLVQRPRPRPCGSPALPCRRSPQFICARRHPLFSRVRPPFRL